MKHKHADLMLAYAQDAQETDRPWERWQSRDPATNDLWSDSVSPIGFFKDLEYRRKHRTIRIGNFDVPEPLRVMPNSGTVYFATSFASDSGCIIITCDGGLYDKRNLKRGMMHLTREAAELHAKALISLTEQQ